jgi:hypothetical protein
VNEKLIEKQVKNECMKTIIGLPNTTAKKLAFTLLWIFILSISCKKELSAVNTSTPPPQQTPPPTTDSFSIFTNQRPMGQTENDKKGGIEVGLKFRSSVSGYAAGIKFYKSTGDSGTLSAQLYSRTGTLLASKAFANETDSGWQTVFFDAAIPIAANTTYIAAYYNGLGNYILTAYALKTAVTNGPLTALADSTDGFNGIFKYTNVPDLPDSGYLSSNYWVDIIFEKTGSN